MNDEENRTSHQKDEATPHESECNSLSAPVSCEPAGAEEALEEHDGDGDCFESADSTDGQAIQKGAAEAVSGDPVQDTDPPAAADSAAPDATDAGEQLRELRNELNALRAEIAARDERLSRMSAEYAEFRTLYPNVPFDAIDDGVMEDFKRGIPLSAAYALAERRRRVAEEQASRINAENSRRTAGALRATEEEYYTPDEVRRMTRTEVRANYQKILKSMQKWH